jgi:replicative DNA helicase
VSLEASVIVALVEDGSPKRAYQADMSVADFISCEEEFRWLEERAERRKPINPRIFKKTFSDFDYIISAEPLGELLTALKQERAYISLVSALDEVSTDLDEENAIDKALQLKEIVNEILRVHSVPSDVSLSQDWEHHMEEIKQLAVLHEQGASPGIPSGLKNIDYHWGGFQNGRLYVILGRPGEGKSFFIAQSAAHAMKEGYRVGLFSPEMNEFEHRCRIHTLLSADRDIQRELNLKTSFRNRSLMLGSGFNRKLYRKFCQYLANMDGDIHLLTQKYRRQKMTPAYIASKAEALGLDLVIVDPLYKLRPAVFRSRDNQVWQLAQVTDEIQDLCESLNIPVIVSNQSNRQIGNRGDAPHKDSSFGSDAPVQEADHVLGVKYFSEEHRLILRCTKHRFGGDFRIEVKFHPNIGVMEDVTPISSDGHDQEAVKEIDDLFGGEELSDAEKAEMEAA